MAFATKDLNMTDNMEMIRRLVTLETELRIEKEQHALAQQCINYMARQLAAKDQRSTTSDLREESQTRVRRLKRCNRGAELRVQPEIEATREQKGNQKAEPEDLLTWDGDDMPVDSLQTPASLPYNASALPLRPGPDQIFRGKYLAFLNREEVRHKPVNANKDTEGTLFTFENKGEVYSETIHPSPVSNAQTLPVPDTRDETRNQQPLTLKSLSDRYKNSKSTADGINASRWAEAEKKVDKPELPEDLMQFPEADEDAEDEEGQEPMTEETMEEQRQKHAAELRKNQALVMYDPAPSEDALRTVLVTEIPKDKSEADVMSMVSGGVIVKMQVMHTTSITGSKTMMITFLHAKDARNFLRSVEGQTKPRFNLLKTPTYPINGYLADDIIYNGITRCLAIYGLHGDISMEGLCGATRGRGLKHDSVINASKDEQGVCHLQFTSVFAALAGRWELCNNLFRRFTRVIYEADPCDRKVPGMEDEGRLEEDHDVGLSEDSRTGEPGDMTEAESETEGGAESELKSAGEKDADGWPVGGLDYD